VERATLTGRQIDVVLALPDGRRAAFHGQRSTQLLDGTMQIGAASAPWRAARIALFDAAHLAAPPPVIREFSAP
jgi:hypothetical protein